MTKGIYIRTEDYKKKLSKAWNYDKHFTDECRKNISLSNSKCKSECGKKNMKGHSGVYIRTNSVWNKGLTKETDKRVKKISDKVKEWRKTQITPKKDTTIEVIIQNFLKELNIEFFTHQYMHIEHGYQCDIIIPSKNIIIECYGTHWHKYPYGYEIDRLRCAELREKGFKVLVFWENEIRVMELNDLKEKLA